MIVILLLVIIAILLFGSGAILGVMGAILTALCIVIVALVFWSAGWVGLLALVGIGALAWLQRGAQLRERERAQDERYAAYLEKQRNEPPRPSADTLRAMAQQKKLVDEYHAKIKARNEADPSR